MQVNHIIVGNQMTYYLNFFQQTSPGRTNRCIHACIAVKDTSEIQVVTAKLRLQFENEVL